MKSAGRRGGGVGWIIFEGRVGVGRREERVLGGVRGGWLHVGVGSGRPREVRGGGGLGAD